MADFTGAPRRALVMAERDPTRFILVGTSHAGNVGAAARAALIAMLSIGCSAWDIGGTFG